MSSFIEETNKGVLIKNPIRFSLYDTFENGQCFRWERTGENSYEGIALNRFLRVQELPEGILLVGLKIEEYKDFWQQYFDIERDYDAICSKLSADETLAKATNFAPGLRVLRQDPWESLASFILSQNNNIKRIKGLVERFSENFGEKIDGGYAFPSVDKIAILKEEDLAPVRAGFRAKYLIDAAQKVANGEVSLLEPYTMQIDEARDHLMQIKGVGPKVANCVLLFGFNRVESLPIDVWVKRALDYFYPSGFPKEFEGLGGIAQQYLFHYTRLSPDSMLGTKSL